MKVKAIYLGNDEALILARYGVGERTISFTPETPLEVGAALEIEMDCNARSEETVSQETVYFAKAEQIKRENVEGAELEAEQKAALEALRIEEEKQLALLSRSPLEVKLDEAIKTINELKNQEA